MSYGWDCAVTNWGRIRLPYGNGPRDHYTAGRSMPHAACRAPGLLAHGQLVPIPARLEG